MVMLQPSEIARRRNGGMFISPLGLQASALMSFCIELFARLIRFNDSGLEFRDPKEINRLCVRKGLR